MTTAAATKVPKHRASKACERCRTRKVRCDIVLRKDRCTNCTLDDLDCVESGPRRRRGTVRRSKATSDTANPNNPSVSESVSWSIVQDMESVLAANLQPNEDVQGPSTVNGAPSLSTTSPEDGHPVPDSNEDLFPDFSGDLLNKGLEVPLFGRGGRGMHINEDDNAFRDLQTLLPPFASQIRSPRIHMYADFLQNQKAFKIPPPKLLQALLIRYIEFVHPQLPLVDLHHVLQAVATGGKEGRVSLLLFQAMLLAASAYVDTQHLLEAGYSNRMALRRELAERARLLYDFDCDADRLVIVQSLILMTSWQDRGDEVKHLRHWISIAYNIAFLLGLNKEVPDSLNLPAKSRSLRKRIWWSLYMRDRTLSLGLRQRPIIAVEVCEISAPVVEDFDIRPASDEICELVHNCALLRNLDQQIRLVDVFRAQLEVSHHIHEVFKARYTVVTRN